MLQDLIIICILQALFSRQLTLKMHLLKKLILIIIMIFKDQKMSLNSLIGECLIIHVRKIITHQHEFAQQTTTP